MKSRILRRTGALLLALALACSLLAVPVAAADISSTLSISADETEIESGDSTTVRLTGAPNGARISWSSGNPQILSVPADASGDSCAVTASTVSQDSTVTVTATVTDDTTGDSGTAACTITVKKPQAPTPPSK